MLSGFNGGDEENADDDDDEDDDDSEVDMVLAHKPPLDFCPPCLLIIIALHVFMNALSKRRIVDDDVLPPNR